MMHLKGESHQMTVDWVSRTLYIAESNITSSAIVSYNLDEGERRIVMERQSRIMDIVVDPYTRYYLLLATNVLYQYFKEFLKNT